MSSAGAYHRAHLEELAQRPNTKVLEATHDFINEPWKVERLRRVMSKIVDDVLASDPEEDNFVIRKRMLEDEEILAFQRQHPRMYYTITDKTLMRDAKARDTIKALLHVRERVERGEITDDKEADATATRVVMSTLTTEES